MIAKWAFGSVLDCGFLKLGSLPKPAFNLSSKDLSVALGKSDSSSRMAQIPSGFSNIMIVAAKSIPKSTIAQSMPSATYSSCSTTNMWWLKNCCSFSFTKLMEICSKPLYSKISNPAMSRTAQKLAFFMALSISVSLHFMISHLKRRSKVALEIPPTPEVACSQVWPLVTHSVPTLIFGLQ